MEFLSFLLLFFLLAVLPLCFLFFSSSKKPDPQENPPTLKTHPIIGSVPDFVKNRHRLLDRYTEILASSPSNTFYVRRIGSIRGFVTANPAVVEHVLKNNFDNFPKGPRSTTILEDFLGRGIFNSDGDQWKVQRKTASFEFNTKSLRSFVVENVRDEVVTRLLPLLEKAARTAGTIDLQDVLERFAFDNVCKVSFNVDPACLVAEGEEGKGYGKLTSGFAQSFQDASNISAERFRYAVPRLWKLKRLLGIGSEKQLAGSIATVHGFATQIIRSRKKERGSSNSSSVSSALAHADLLSRFIANEESSEEYLRDIVISFILAGRETTSSALSWFFWLLSSRPHVEQKILEELKSVRAKKQTGDSDETFGFEELRGMHYLHAAISESLRLYPPVPMNWTMSRADDVLPDGSVLRKGWSMAYSSYAMGRMESIWGEDCLEYKPERWLEDGVFKPANPYKFPVFHAGPRMCLGKEMAYIQMKSIAASVLERFEVVVPNKEVRPEMMMSLTLRMKRGLPVQVKQRSSG